MSNNRTITWGGSRNISWVQIQGDIYAYRSEILLNDKPAGVVEGIATLKAIKSVKQDDDIQNLTITIGGKKGDLHHRKEIIYLCKKELFEVWRSNLYGRDEYYEGIRQNVITEPYTYLMTNSLDGVALLAPSNYDGNLYGLDGEIHPRAIFFDYIDARLRNECYDLEAALKVLKKRKDLVWLDERGRPGEPEILPIPYYNNDGGEEFLTFAWIPSNKDWNKIKQYAVGAKWDLAPKILDIVFGVKEKTKRERKHRQDDDDY